MPACIHAEQAHIQHVGEARDGEPVGGLGRKRPPQAAGARVIRIVVVDEGGPEKLRIDAEGGEDQRGTNPDRRERSPRVRLWLAGCLAGGSGTGGGAQRFSIAPPQMAPALTSSPPSCGAYRSLRGPCARAHRAGRASAETPRRIPECRDAR